MKLKHFLNRILAALLVAVLFLASCKDDNTYVNYNYGLDVTFDYVRGQQMMALLMETYFKSITDSAVLAGGHGKIDSADVYIRQPEGDSLIISYPSWGKDDGNGHWRAGRIQISIPSNGFLNPDFDYRFQFVNFSYDKDPIQVNGMVLRYRGKEGPADAFSLLADTIHQQFTDSTSSNRFVLNQSVWVYNLDWAGDSAVTTRMEIFGEMNGRSSVKLPYFTQTPAELPLIQNFGCEYLKQGPAAIQFEEDAVFGNVFFPAPDTCQNQYVLEIEGNPFPHPIDTHDW